MKKKITSRVKKAAAILMSVLMGAMLLSGCSAASAKSGNGGKTVTVWAGGSDNVRVQFEKQIEQFNASQKDYTAELQFITSGTGAQGLFDRAVAAKKAGQTNTDYDVIELGGDEVTRYVKEGGEDFFIPLDKSKIENSKNLKVQAMFRDDLVMPYRGTTVVLAYNSDAVKEPPKTTEELYQWIKDHPGRFAYNTPGSGGAGGSFVTTSVYNFVDGSALTSSDPANKEQWDQGFELMKELHPYMYKSSGKVVYPNKNQGTLDLLANKEVDMIPAWADMAITQMKQGALPESIKISQITPAFTGSPVVLGIPSIGSNQEGAYAFLNYMLSPEAQNTALDTMAAIPVIDFSLLDSKLTETIKDLKIDEFRISSLGDLGTQLYERWDSEIGTLK
jgi:putative spermidine/putrescine transport system substrate-binding protein